MKTIKSTLSLVLLFAITFLSAQTSQKRDVGNFDAISVQSGIDLYLTQDNKQSVEVKAKSDIIDKVLTEIQGSTLKIYLEKSNGRWWNWKNTGPINVYVSVDELRKLTASGGSDVESSGTWKSDEFEIVASGGSDISMSVDINTLEVQCSGGSDINIEGVADMLELTSSGGSDFNGRNLICKEGRIQSSGGSDAYVHIKDKLVARASGASDIHYKGDPKIRDIDTSSSSDVKKYN